MIRAGIVLCGGESRRMGRPKATLPFGPEPMLNRVLRLLEPVVPLRIIVAAPGQPLPDLPPGVRVARDPRRRRGPVEALWAGLRAAEEVQAEAAFVTGCDVPLLVPAVVERLLEWLGTHQAAVPVDPRFHHPLSAVYRTDVLSELDKMRADERAPLVSLFDRIDTLRVPVEQLRDVDPELRTLANVNTPDDYLDALRQAGFEPPDDI